MRRFTTRKQDTEFLLKRFADAVRVWAIGDKCLTYDKTAETTVVAVDGDIVTLANGDKLHCSRMRGVS